MNKRTPKWDSEKGKAYASDLEILATISSYKNQIHFIKLLGNIKAFTVYGTTTYEQDVSAYYGKQKCYYKNYGEVFVKNFYSHQQLSLMSDNEKAILIWDKCMT